ncbi:hypothetical protein [Nocardioides kribbensis]|uniref:DUF4177 domain-containing protein n=1 Tax=Nocardioides kribbensis TaxID=305517 RepID=A0ABV1NTD1_9ACTN
MEQTVTLIQSSSYNYELFGPELGRVQHHVEEMSRQGWHLICTEMPDRTNTPILMFWRRD